MYIDDVFHMCNYVVQVKPSLMFSGNKTLLRGMTWDHSRGYVPMVATSQRFHELHPDVDIDWTKRSLQAFADKPLAELAELFDLLVIDHPWVGCAGESGCLLDLANHLSGDFLAIHAANSVGKSFESYRFNGGLWALAIDAAAPVSANRPDLLEKAGVNLPQTWDDVISLGRMGLVCCPSIPLDVYGNFLNICVSDGEPIFPSDEEVVFRSAGLRALERLRELVSIVPAQFFALNPIQTCELMTQTDDFAYCPFTYGYSNYARDGYAPNVIKFGRVVRLRDDVEPSTMLGGTGLAISAKCKSPETALEYLKFVGKPETQRGLYFTAGGQPADRTAWLDSEINEAASGHFADTLPSLDRAFLRPRYPGYVAFQDRAGAPIHTFVREGGNPDKVLDTLNKLYRESRPAA
jgi:multiple sugar transport system substrate-binding protein